MQESCFHSVLISIGHQYKHKVNLFLINEYGTSWYVITANTKNEAFIGRLLKANYLLKKNSDYWNYNFGTHIFLSDKIDFSSAIFIILSIIDPLVSSLPIC